MHMRVLYFGKVVLHKVGHQFLSERFKVAGASIPYI